MNGTSSWVILTAIFAVASGLLWRFRDRLVGHGVFVSRGVVLYGLALTLITSGLGLAVVVVKIA